MKQPLAGTLVLFAWAISLPLQAQDNAKPAESAPKDAPKVQAGQAVTPAPAFTAASKARLVTEFQQIRKTTDLGEWKKADLAKPPEEKAPAEEKARYRRKVEELMEFRTEERFQALAMVDELEFLSASDKAACKERLKVQNPILE